MDQEYVFECPKCTAEIRVDATVREDLLATGCVVCATRADPDDFDVTDE